MHISAAGEGTKKRLAFRKVRSRSIVHIQGLAGAPTGELTDRPALDLLNHSIVPFVSSTSTHISTYA